LVTIFSILVVGAGFCARPLPGTPMQWRGTETCPYIRKKERNASEIELNFLQKTWQNRMFKYHAII